MSYSLSVPRRIVGVAGEVRLLGLDVEPAPQIYIPVMQEARALTMTLVLRSTLTPSSAARDARAALRRLDNSLPVYDVQPMTELVSDSIAARRFNTLLMGLFAGLALLLSAVGIYGVLSGMVGERLHEIGVRMALGADRPQILLLIVRQGMKQALAGTAVGTGSGHAAHPPLIRPALRGEPPGWMGFHGGRTNHAGGVFAGVPGSRAHRGARRSGACPAQLISVHWLDRSRHHATTHLFHDHAVQHQSLQCADGKRRSRPDQLRPALGRRAASRDFECRLRTGAR